MKKLICGILALVVCIAGCAFAEAADVTGDWYLNVIESEGVQMDPVLLGSELMISLNADGFAELKSGEESGFANWHMDGGNVVIVYEDGQTMTACPDAGNLVIDDQEAGLVMILGRQRQELEGYAPAPVVSAPAMQDFVGTWNAVSVDMMGMQLPMDALDMQLVVDIAADSAVVTHIEGEENTLYTAPLHLEGSVLTIEAVDDQMPIRLQLQQDGKLVYAEDAEGLVMNMYFEKIA